MRTLKIVRTSLRFSSPGNFSTIARGEELVVPKRVAKALSDLGIKTAEEFLSQVNKHPRSIALKLGWSTEDVIRAKTTLVDAIRGKVRRRANF